MLKIMLVEDDKTIVTNLTEYLNGAGYIVRSVSGQSAAMAAPDRSGSLPCAAAVLLWGTVSVEALQKAKTVVLCARTPASCRCREVGTVYPRRISVRGQPIPCHGGHGGDRKGRTVCGTLYTDAHAVRSQPAVL